MDGVGIERADFRQAILPSAQTSFPASPKHFLSKQNSHVPFESGLPKEVKASLAEAGFRQPELLKALAVLCEHVANLMANRVFEATSAEHGDIFLDQSSSPLGPRRHISAIRSGALPGKRVGRRYIALTSDVEKFLSESDARATNRRPRDQESLAKELGVSDLL